MDDVDIQKNMYENLKKIKSVKSLNEFMDIEKDIIKINATLCNGYYTEWNNGIGISKDVERVYKELYQKYTNKEEWRYCGFIGQHRIFYNFYGRLPYNGQINYYMLLSNLRTWIIKYLQYKIYKEKLDEGIEEIFKLKFNIK